MTYVQYYETKLDGKLVVQGEAEHRCDADCAGYIDPETDLCTICGVDHGSHCIVCAGRGYHKDGCPEL